MKEAERYDAWVEYNSVMQAGQNKLRVLSIGTDATIFESGVPSRTRLQAYAQCLDELHVISYISYSSQFQAEHISPNIWFYPASSRLFSLQPFYAFRIGKRIIEERKINIISVQDPAESGMAGWLLKRASGLPLQIQIHADFFSPHFRKNSWKELVRYCFARFIIPRGDIFRVVSERIRASLISNFQFLISKPIVVLPIFVDCERIARTGPTFGLHKKYPQFDFIILMVLRLMREKNIGLALEAFAELLKEFPKTGLVIVGDGPEHGKLKVKSEKLKIAASVRFDGWREDLVSYYKTADLYLLTSNFEGYGRTVVEAAAAGLPIVMTNVGVAGEIIRDGQTGRVVRVGDKSALIGALAKARRNYAAMQKMAERAQKKVLAMEPRTWEEYLALYRRSFEITIDQSHPEGAGRRISRDSSLRSE